MNKRSFAEDPRQKRLQMMENGWNNRFYLGTVPEYDASRVPHRSSFVETSFFRKRLMNALEDKNIVKVSIMPSIAYENDYSSEQGLEELLYNQDKELASPLDSSKRRRSIGALTKGRSKGSESLLIYPSSKAPPQSRRPSTQNKKKLSPAQSPYLFPLVPLVTNGLTRLNKVRNTTSSLLKRESSSAGLPRRRGKKIKKSDALDLYEKSLQKIEKLWDEMSISECERRCFLSDVKLSDNRSRPSKIVLKLIALEIQALKKHKADTLELLKLIDLRERHLEELRRLIERKDLVDASYGLKGRHVLVKNVERLATIIRLTTMDIVEFIDQKWRIGKFLMKPFIWKSSNYIKKMESDMSFFLQSELLPDNISSNGVNPLLLETSLSDRAPSTTPQQHTDQTPSILPSLQRTYPRGSFSPNSAPNSHGETLLKRAIRCEHIILKEDETSRKYEQNIQKQMLAFGEASSGTQFRCHPDLERRVKRKEKRDKERIRGQKSAGQIRHGASVLDGLLAGWGVDNKNMKSNGVLDTEARSTRKRKGSKMADDSASPTEMKDEHNDRQLVLDLRHEKSTPREHKEEANGIKDLTQHLNTVANEAISSSINEHSREESMDGEILLHENKSEIEDHQVEQEDNEATYAAVMIQKQVKGFLARKEYQILVKKNEISALTLQKMFRGHLARKAANQKRQVKHDEEQEKRVAATISIQKTYRGYSQRQRLQQEDARRKRKEQAALVIQKTFRGYFERQRIKRSRRAEEDASNHMLKQENAAILVQRVYRGYYDRKCFQIVKKEREKENERLFESNVIKCQALGRSYLAKKRIMTRRAEIALDQFVEIEKCVIECQRYTRGFLAKRRVQQLQEERRNNDKNHGISKIEDGNQSPPSDIGDEKMNILENGMSLNQETHGTGFEEETDGHREESQVRDRTVKDQEIASIKIQSIVRRYLARCRYQNHHQLVYELHIEQELKCEQSVLLLQRNIRAFLGRLQSAKMVAKRSQEIEEYIQQERAAFGLSQAEEYDTNGRNE